MLRFLITRSLVTGAWLTTATVAQAAPCLFVTLTGTQGGPSTFIGVAGPGTLVRYGDRGNNCGAMILQFDAGEARPCV